MFNDGLKRKAFGYTRVSTDEQVPGASLENQKDIIQDFADKNNIEIVEWFEDPGFSAKNANRPALKQMKLRAKELKRDVDLVLIYNYTRISRDLQSYFCDIKTPLDACGINVFSVTEPVDFESSVGNLSAYFSLIGGEIDNRRKSQTSRDNMKALASQGWYQTTPPVGLRIKKIPIGIRDKYGKEKCRSTLEPNTANGISEKVSFLLERFAEGDISVADAWRLAQKEGIKGRTGKLIPFDTFCRMLRNPAYAGYICSERLTNNELIKMPYYDGIISLETFNRIQAVLSGNVRELKASNANWYPLKGTLFCKECGRPIRASAPVNGSGKPSPRYHCTESGHGSIRIEEAHDLFNSLLQQITPNEDAIKLFKEIIIRIAKQKFGDAKKELDRLEAEWHEVDDLINGAIGSFIQKEISLEDKNNFVEKQKIKKHEIECEMERVRKNQNINQTTIDYVCSFISQPAKLWRNADLESKQNIQKIIFPNGLHIDLHNKEQKFGTADLSPLYSVVNSKKGSEDPDNSHLVTRARVERATISLGRNRSIH